MRTKYNFFRARGGGLAAAVDVRTPTGDESNLLGTGGVQTKVYGVASVAVGKLSPHANVGYTSSSGGALPGTTLKDEVNYTVGFDLAVTPRISVIADVLGRSIRDGTTARGRQGVRVRADRPWAARVVAEAAVGAAGAVGAEQGRHQPLQVRSQCGNFASSPAISISRSAISASG